MTRGGVTRACPASAGPANERSLDSPKDLKEQRSTVVAVTQDPTREYVSDASALPVINQRVQVQLSVDEESDQAATGVPSRVEDVIVVTGKKPVQEVLFAPPRYEGDVEPPRPGHPMAIVWSTARGVLELPVAFLDVERVGEIVSAWRVRVTGPAVRVQRRHFVRVTFVTPLVLTLLDLDEKPSLEALTPAPAPAPAPVKGATVDLSEGGLRCVLECELPAEAPVTAQFAFGAEAFRLEARIVRAFPHAERPGYTGPPRWDTAVRFVNPDLAGDSLRKSIFAEQMRQRRSNGI
jgi:hypothetical protein